MNIDEIFGEIKEKNKYSTPTFTIIYGDVGCGKTVLATSAQELGQCVLINFENRISHIEETKNMRIVPKPIGEFREDKACSYVQFLSFLSFIEKKDVKFDYLIIDTIDEMFVKFTQGMLKKGEISDKYYGRPEIYNKIWESLKKIKDLGISIIATCHQKENKKIELLMVDALKSRINMTVDNIFNLRVTDEDNRILTLKPNSNVTAKLTVAQAKYNNVVAEIENPTWKLMQEILNNA